MITQLALAGAYKAINIIYIQLVVFIDVLILEGTLDLSELLYSALLKFNQCCSHSLAL